MTVDEALQIENFMEDYASPEDRDEAIHVLAAEVQRLRELNLIYGRQDSTNRFIIANHELSLAHLYKENQKVREGIESVRCLINNSSGVAGLHLNGDLAPWEDLQEGGHFETWLIAFNEAETSHS